MKLRPQELGGRATEAGVSVEDLARAIERPGLTGPQAVSAVRNWLGGRDHPRCKKSDIEAMSAAVGCRPKDISRFVSRVRNHRGSPKKAQLVMDMIRGKTFEDARLSLQFSTKRAAVNVHKALMAAYAEAEELGADGNRLVVAESRVDGGLHIKRFQPKDRGRAHPILKRTSHITVGVQER